jgi:hypothetical protein
MTLPFPFAVIDFEASSLSDERSYPIEVGFAVALSEHEPIQVWSSLIRPAPEWITRGTWSARSAAVHGITLAGLAEGATPIDVANTLNALAAKIPRWFCDGGDWDTHWLRRLFDAARTAPSFALKDVSALIDTAEQRASFIDALAGIHAPHRAGPDAERLCAAILIAHGFEVRAS